MLYNYHHYNILKYPCDFVGEVSQTWLELVPLFLLAMDYNTAERMVGEK